MYKTEYNDIKANLIKKSLDQKEQEVLVPIERRKRKDGVLQFINLMSFLLWGGILIIIAIITKAGKNLTYIVEKNLLWQSSAFWEIDLLKTSLLITAICIFVCTMSIILNFSRYRRRTDRINRSLIVCEIVSFTIGIFLVFKLLF